MLVAISHFLRPAPIWPGLPFSWSASAEHAASCCRHEHAHWSLPKRKKKSVCYFLLQLLTNTLGLHTAVTQSSGENALLLSIIFCLQGWWLDALKITEKLSEKMLLNKRKRNLGQALISLQTTGRRSSYWPWQLESSQCSPLTVQPIHKNQSPPTKKRTWVIQWNW